MLLGITYIGWAVYLAAYIPAVMILLAGIGLATRLFTPSRRVLATVLLPLGIPLIAYPLLETQYSRWIMRKQCPEAQGLTIYKRVVVEGYFDENDVGNYLQENADKHLLPVMKKNGYRFREYFDRFSKKYMRIDRRDEEIKFTVLKEQSARYRLTEAKEFVIGLHVKKREQHVLDSVTNMPIASNVMVFRTPSFVDRLWLMYFGPFAGVEGCPRDYSRSLSGSNSVLKEILIPIDQK